MLKSERERLYRQMMGADAAERQEKAFKKKKGRCVCNFQMVKQRWDGTTLSVRKIHEPSCPQWKWWMSEDNVPSTPREEN